MYNLRQRPDPGYYELLIYGTYGGLFDSVGAAYRLACALHAVDGRSVAIIAPDGRCIYRRTQRKVARSN
jgi:hypothetical protein